MPRLIRRFIFIILPLTLIFLIAFAFVVNYYANALTKAGSWPITGTPSDVGLLYQDVTLTTSDGLNISGWYIPGSTAKAVITVHGIWGNKQDTLPAAIMLFETGYHVLMIDMRGHGKSEGNQITYGYREALDVLAATEFLTALPEVERVGVIGHSLGGAAVVKAAAMDDRLQAVVIESSFSSLADAVNDSFSRHTHLPRWPFASILVKATERKLGVTIDQIDSVHDLATMSPRPILIIHGRQDDLFPVGHAYRMYEAAQPPKDLWIIEGLEHEYPLDHKAEYRRRVLKFFETALNVSN